MKYLRRIIIFCLIVIILCGQDIPLVTADNTERVQNIELTTTSIVSIDPIFGEYISAVDKNIYYSMTTVDASTVKQYVGDYNTPMYNGLLKWINPCMAFATTWGEAGSSYKGVSMTTVMDFNPNTYQEQIDWLNVTSNLEQVGVEWYYANAKVNYNTNVDGKAYHMPNALLQIPSNGDRSTSEMLGLGVGPYQVTSSDWDKYILEDRVNPVEGFRVSLQKVGTSWINCGIDPSSDLTVYAALSLGHQGGGLISYQFGKELIQIINRDDVQQAFLRAGRQMFLDFRDKACVREVSLVDIDASIYLAQVEAETGIDFSDYTGGPGPTNKGNYVCLHLLRYIFYKNYFTSGTGEVINQQNNYVQDNTLTDNTNLVAQSDYVYGTHEHVAYRQSKFLKDINSTTTIAGAGCGWCSLTSAMAELNPTMCGGLTPVDWLDTEMKSVGEQYWTGNEGMWYGGVPKWISTMNEIGIYGQYEIMEEGGGGTYAIVQKIMKYAGDKDKVVLLSSSAGLFTSGGHIIVAVDLSDNEGYFHIADSSGYAAAKLGESWETMSSYDFPGIDEDGNFVTSLNGYNYNFKHYWVIRRIEE